MYWRCQSVRHTKLIQLRSFWYLICCQQTNIGWVRTIWSYKTKLTHIGFYDTLNLPYLNKYMDFQPHWGLVRKYFDRHIWLCTSLRDWNQPYTSITNDSVDFVLVKQSMTWSGQIAISLQPWYFVGVRMCAIPSWYNCGHLGTSFVANGPILVELGQYEVGTPNQAKLASVTHSNSHISTSIWTWWVIEGLLESTLIGSYDCVLPSGTQLTHTPQSLMIMVILCLWSSQWHEVVK